MSQHIYKYPCNYVIGPHLMFHVSQLYSKASSSKSTRRPLRSSVREYFEIICEKKVHCKLCMSPATTTLCVCMRACACVCACMHAWIRCMRLCVCAQIIRYLIVKEATIRIAKITIRFSTSMCVCMYV